MSVYVCMFYAWLSNFFVTMIDGRIFCFTRAATIKQLLEVRLEKKWKKRYAMNIQKKSFTVESRKVSTCTQMHVRMCTFIEV
jgi:hypothetical protein